MNRDLYKPATWLMWLALPMTGLNYWQTWDRLPRRMAVHVDANWQPNGYTSRESALMLGIGIIAVMLIVSTVAALIARALKPDAASWAVLAIFYVSLGLGWYANHLMIEFNVPAPPAQSELVGPIPSAMNNSDGQAVLQPHL